MKFYIDQNLDIRAELVVSRPASIALHDAVLDPVLPVHYLLNNY